MASGVKIASVTTDGNVSVGAMMAEEFPQIEHKLDAWHCINAVKRVVAYTRSCRLQFFARLTGKFAKREVTQKWLRRLRAHMWTTLERCEGDVERITKRITSMERHIIGDHSQCELHKQVGRLALVVSQTYYSALMHSKRWHIRCFECAAVPS